jgi:hypothetical protein
MAAFWRVMGTVGSATSLMGNYPRRRRLVGQIDDIAGLDFDIEIGGGCGGGADACGSEHEAARSRTMLSAQSMSSAFTSAARPAAMAMVRMARWRMYSATARLLAPTTLAPAEMVNSLLIGFVKAPARRRTIPLQETRR